MKLVRHSSMVRLAFWMSSVGACSSGSAAHRDGGVTAAHDGGRVTDAGGVASTASGMLDSRAFDSVADSWWIGAPDDPKRTRVIYVFDKAVTCAEISQPGWDTSVGDQTQSLEIKLIGTKPGKYPLPANGGPATGEADVNYTLTARTGTPSEIGASSGSVRLEQLTTTFAEGSFDLTFDTGSVLGTFHAVYCKDGHEP